MKIIRNKPKKNEQLLPLRMPSEDGHRWCIYLEVRRNLRTTSLCWDYESGWNHWIDVALYEHCLNAVSNEWERESSNRLKCWPFASGIRAFGYPHARFGYLPRLMPEVAIWFIETLPSIYERAAVMYEREYGTKEKRMKALAGLNLTR